MTFAASLSFLLEVEFMNETHYLYHSLLYLCPTHVSFKFDSPLDIINNTYNAHTKERLLYKSTLYFFFLNETVSFFNSIF